jgi:hypothetical protein
LFPTPKLWLDVIRSAHPTPNNFTTHLQQITSKDHANERWISSFFPFFSPTAVALQRTASPRKLGGRLDPWRRHHFSSSRHSNNFGAMDVSEKTFSR